MIHKLLSALFIGKKGTLKRSTLICARYEMGLALLAYQREHPCYKDHDLYHKMEKHIVNATKVLIKENTIEEDECTPVTLRGRITYA